MSKVNVAYTCACDKCGSVNTRSEKKMELDDFNKESKASPSEYWKEEVDGKLIYRHHEESSKGRCRTSC